MEHPPDGIQIATFTFITNFDSANLGRVELIPKTPPLSTVQSSSRKVASTPAASRASLKPPKPPPTVELADFEFNLWTKPDCQGTQFENSNRTWFHFGVRGGPPFSLVKLNLVDLNKQGRMYRDGMAPVYRISPGRPWERVRDKPVYTVLDNVFTLSFKFRTLESPKAVIYFAFTYPYSYVDLQTQLSVLDSKLSKPDAVVPKCDVRFTKGLKLSVDEDDKIYYHREVMCYTLENRRVDLITVSSHHNISSDLEPRLAHLFPETNSPRCRRFKHKKVVIVSARVHPGETPSSFVLNGLLSLLLSREDPIALLLRRHFVFKLIPMLNPDGVARGHYRTDTRGVNLNRFYLNPDVRLHPSIYAARALIRYHHHGKELPDDQPDMPGDLVSHSDGSSSPEGDPMSSSMETLPMQDLSIQSSHSDLSSEPSNNYTSPPEETESGLYLYIDMHGHASKKGIFMYGNHLKRTEDNVDCMLLPKIMTLNSQNFHFPACNFTERNMYLRDKRDGTSREGCGRVAVLRLTGLVRSYTLECNYNTGRVVNVLPACSRDLPSRNTTATQPANLLYPPKYCPAVYEEVGRAIGVSILDLINSNPWSRIPNSEFHTMGGIREWLRLKNLSETFTQSRGSTVQPRPKRPSQVIVSVRSQQRSSTKKSSAVRLSPLPGKSLDSAMGDWEPKSNLLRPTAVRNICAQNIRPSKPKHAHRSPEEQETEKKITTVNLALESGIKIKSSLGEPSSFKQSPKRLKMCKGEGDRKKSSGTSSAENATPLEGSVPPTVKKRLIKPRPQLSPLKFKKSLEKRRTSDKKTKIMYKKASKLALSASDLVKSDRKRRNVVP